MEHLTPLKAIKAKCLDCCCYQIAEVRKCTAVNCPLHYYRFGKNPKLKGKRGNPNIALYKKSTF